MFIFYIHNPSCYGTCFRAFKHALTYLYLTKVTFRFIDEFISINLYLEIYSFSWGSLYVYLPNLHDILYSTIRACLWLKAKARNLCSSYFLFHQDQGYKEKKVQPKPQTATFRGALASSDWHQVEKDWGRCWVIKSQNVRFTALAD